MTIPDSIDGIPVTALGEGWTNVRADGVMIVANIPIFKDSVDANYNNTVTSVVIPRGVTSIGIGAFSQCEALTRVIIPQSVTNIGAFAFAWSRLAGVSIPGGVTNIGYEAFRDCSIFSLTIPDSVQSIGEGAFADCKELLAVTIGNGVTNIGARAFAGCDKLISATVPSSVKVIGLGAFSGDALARVCFRGDRPTIRPDEAGRIQIISSPYGGRLCYPESAAGWLRNLSGLWSSSSYDSEWTSTKYSLSKLTSRPVSFELPQTMFQNASYSLRAVFNVGRIDWLLADRPTYSVDNIEVAQVFGNRLRVLKAGVPFTVYAHHAGDEEWAPVKVGVERVASGIGQKLKAGSVSFSETYTERLVNFVEVDEDGGRFSDWDVLPSGSFTARGKFPIDGSALGASLAADTKVSLVLGEWSYQTVVGNASNFAPGRKSLSFKIPSGGTIVIAFGKNLATWSATAKTGMNNKREEFAASAAAEGLIRNEAYSISSDEYDPSLPPQSEPVPVVLSVGGIVAEGEVPVFVRARRSTRSYLGLELDLNSVTVRGSSSTRTWK